LSAFSFCKDARGSARDGRSQSLSPLKSKIKQISNEVCFFCLRIFRVYILEKKAFFLAYQ